jgi:penicillin-binding protein 1A
MVGGDDYSSHPFNLATQGRRQPGSSFKPFVLARALEDGISPDSTWESKKRTYILKGGERFTVNNYNDAYAGLTTLANATTFSDNSVYAQLGFRVKPQNIARMAHRVGIRTPISRNYAIALGGLRQGVTPLDMAHAYETFATGGRLTFGSLSPGPARRPGPVGIEEIGRGAGADFKPIELPDGDKAVNQVRQRRVLSPPIAGTIQSLLQTVVRDGTATRAQIPNVIVAGKTGTTENYGDAWFVGWTKEYTVAVWVGYPDRLQPMKTEFRGQPVAGGTYPAEIWKTFMEALLKIDPLPQPKEGTLLTPSAPGTPAPAPGAPPAPVAPAPTTAPGGTTGAAAPAPARPSPKQPAPTQTQPAPAQPAPGGGPTPAPSGGGGGPQGNAAAPAG